MQAFVKKWGNSYAVRLTKRDLERLGIRPGQRVDLVVQPSGGPVDVAAFPIVRGKRGDSFEEVRRSFYRSKQRWEG